MGNVQCCKRPDNIEEDKAQIYALFTDGESKENGPEDTPYVEPIPENTLRSKKKNQEDYLKKLFEICERNGPVKPYEDFMFDGWQKYYTEPQDTQFFEWDKGEVNPDQVMVSNEDDPVNLEIYQGDLSPDNSKKHGYGVATTPQYVRIGCWRDGEFTGWGRESRRNGEVLEGRYVNGEVDGKGVFTKEGFVYEGDFVHSKKLGKGKLETNGLKYEGDVKDGKFNGQGKLEFKRQGHMYEGDFKESKLTGKGKFSWNNGDLYEGEMTDGKMNGYGIYKYKDGTLYEGNFVNGIKEGQGRITYPNGKVFEGEFKNGHAVGDGSLLRLQQSIPIQINEGKTSIRKK